MLSLVYISFFFFFTSTLITSRSAKAKARQLNPYKCKIVQGALWHGVCELFNIVKFIDRRERERGRGEETTRCGKINRRNVRSDTRKRLCFDVSDYRMVAFGKGIRNFDGNVIGWRKKKTDGHRSVV